MADTRIQLEVEDWVRRNWMPTQYGSKFSRERLPLRSGGVFDFDAVSEDRSIVGTISTSGARTSERLAETRDPGRSSSCAQTCSFSQWWMRNDVSLSLPNRTCVTGANGRSRVAAFLQRSNSSAL